MRFIQRVWRDVLRGENIDLYLAVITALVLTILNLLGLASDKLVAPVTLAVLGLLAISNLGTRYYIEKQLEKFLSTSNSGFRSRSDLPPLIERGRLASEIVIVGISLISAVIPHLDFFEQKIKEGCKVKFLLLDPTSPSLQTFNLMSHLNNVEGDIEQTLRSLDLLMQRCQKSRGKCEVRLANVFLPFGIAAFDPNKDTGLMNVELIAYKKYIGERPHVTFNRGRESKWFVFFKDQYEELWSSAKPWTGYS